MPDRYIGHRTPEGGWSWKAADPPPPKRRHHTPLIALAATGAVVLCLFGAGILLVSNEHRAEPSASPAATSEPTFSLMVWNPEADQWQSENLNLAPTSSRDVTFLLSISSLDRMTHEVGVTFECAREGGIELVPVDAAAASLTAPGPGRVRPDATALAGALTAWNATFSRAPEWDAEDACSELQTLNFVATSRGETSSFMWETNDTADLPLGETSLSVAASVNGEIAQTLSVGY